MERLELDGNPLEQSLPNLSALTHLTYLDLSGAQLNGPIDASFFPASLTTADLENNSLDDVIGVASAQSALTSLDLENNAFKSISDFSTFKVLSSLNLRYNEAFTTPINASHLPLSLQGIELYGTPLNQTIPNLSRLINLTYLGLDSTQLTGTINATYFPVSLVTLKLQNNQLQGALPDFSHLVNLTGLYLYNNQLIETVNGAYFPASLHTLNLSINQLTEIINAAHFPASLKTLDLDNNQLQGSLPNFSQLTVEGLDLSDNQLTGTVNPTYFPLSLEILDLADNQLQGSLLDFSQLNNLKNIRLYNNQLSGPINVAHFPTHLTSLSLSNNQLSGDLPDFTALSQLSSLYLSSNQLTGSIPNFPTSLKRLDLNNNQFEGDIPLSLTQLTNLCSECPENEKYTCGPCLDLGNNHLNIFVPSAISAFLEAPGNKDINWAESQTFLLFTCPEGGSFGVKPDPRKFDFGTEVVGQTTTIRLNTRARDCETAQISDIVFSGVHANEFTFTGDPKQSCYSGYWRDHHYAACQFTLKFTPQAAGQKQDTFLEFVFDAQAEAKPILVMANAVGSGAPQIQVDPMQYDFGEVVLGNNTAEAQPFTLLNNGNINLKSPSFDLAGNNPLDFSFDSWGCAHQEVLPPSAEVGCELVAQFIPSSGGQKQADLLIQALNAPDTAVPLTGMAQIPDACSDANITAESKQSGNWNNPETWVSKRIPTSYDNVRINPEHAIIGTHFVAVNALCIAAEGVLKSPNDQGQPLIVHAERYLENKGSIKGQNGADEVSGTAACQNEYWSVIGAPSCAQPGASLILSVGKSPQNVFLNEGIIIAGNGGHGNLHHAFGGDVSIYGGTLMNNTTDTLCGTIKAGDGGLVDNNGVNQQQTNIPTTCMDYTNTRNSVAPNNTDNNTQGGRAGKGGDLTLLAGHYLYSQGAVQILAGDGGNCSPSQTQGGAGGSLRLNAPMRVDLAGGYFEAGQGSNNCQNNGENGDIFIEPSVISLAGASTKVDGDDITIFGGDNWVLDLSHLENTAIKAKGDITLAVGEEGLVDLRGNANVVLEAQGQVNIFSDDILLDKETNLNQVIKAKDIVVGPSRILYDVAWLGAGKLVGGAGSTASVQLTLANNGPTVDSYQLTVEDPQGLILEAIPPVIENLEGLKTQTIDFTVTFPSQWGATHVIMITATSQANEEIKAVAELPVVVDIIPVLPELPQIPLLETCPQTQQINYFCDNHEQTLTDIALGNNASIAGGHLAGTIENQGLVAQVTIQPDTQLIGGRLTGYIVNQGTLTDFEFVGAQIVGGTLAGNITNNSKIGGTFKDVRLAANTHIIGGTLTGCIQGDPEQPAVLEHLEVAPGSRLSGVTLGLGVNLGSGVIVADDGTEDHCLPIDNTPAIDESEDNDSSPVTNNEPIALDDSLTEAEPAEIVEFNTQVPQCPTRGFIDWICNARGQIVHDLTIGQNGNIAAAIVQGSVLNQGWVSNLTISAESTLSGGTVTGAIINHGKMLDFEFRGEYIKGGTLAGQITNASPIGGYFQDIQLAAETEIRGGILAGKIMGSAEAPARLKQLVIKPNSELAHVIIGDQVKLPEDITLGENVSFTHPEAE
ncbi:MAG: leucine-rich repeat domain-containing protein, partial [Pseudomonadota bacterium]|nr:leucine-rich repeat domain-containing protein [Pseudomonadota bacterium]